MKAQLVNADGPVITVESGLCALRGAEGTAKGCPRVSMSKETTLTTRERLRVHLQEAKRATTSPAVEAQLTAALDVWDDLPPTPLQECPVCEKVGLPERIQQHRCE